MKGLSIFNLGNFRKDLVIAFAILIMPFIFFLYNLAPGNVNFWDVKIFSIYSGETMDINIYVWLLFVRVFTVFIISTWFVTCKNWWRFALFVPLTIEIYKLIGVFDSVHHFIENLTIVKIFPIAFLYSWLMVFISKKLNYHSILRNLGDQLDAEIDKQTRQMSTFKVEDYKQYKKQLLELRKEKETMDRQAYLKKLILLRDEMENY